MLEKKKFLGHKKCRKRILFFLLIFFVSAGALTSLFYLDYFKIKNVVFNGISVLSENELREEIESVMSAKLFKIIPRDRIFYLPEEQMRSNLLAKFNRLSKLEINKDFPSRLLIKIEERKPSGVLCQTEIDKEECFFVDTTGFIFEKAPIFSSGVFLKFIDERGGASKEGKFLLPQKTFQRILIFKKQAEAIFLISEVHLKKEGIYEFFTSEGRYLILDEKDDWGLVYENLTILYENVIKNELENLDYIDLRFGNKVFYKYD